MGAISDEWDAIKADPEYRAQPPAEQTRVALSFFNKRYAPVLAAHAEDVDQARHDFFAETFAPPPAAAAPSLPSMAGTALKQTLTEPVPVLGKVADAVRTDIPAAIADTAGRVGAAATRAGLPPAVEKGANIAGALTGTAVGTAGEIIPKTGADLAAAGLGGPVLEGAGELGARAAPKVVSTLTGASLPEATRAISRAKELMNPTLLKPETVDNATQAIGDSIKAARGALGRRLGLAEDTAAAKFPGRIVHAAPIADELARNLQKAGIAADGVAPGRDVPNPVRREVQDIIDKLRNLGEPEPGPLGLYPQRNSGGRPLSGGAADLSALGVEPAPRFDAMGLPVPEGPSVSRGAGGAGMAPAPGVRSPRPLSLPDALQVKRDIYDMVSYDKSKLLGLGDKETSFLKDAAKNLDDHIRAIGGDELNAATDKFASAAKGYDKLAKDAMSGRVDTIQRRLGRVFNAGDIERKVADPMAAAGGGQAALNTLLDAKTAQRMTPALNPKLTRAFENTGGGVAGNTLKIMGAGLGAEAAPGSVAQKLGVAAALGAVTSPALNNAAIRAAMVPIGDSAAVDALASPAARALVASPLIRRLRQGKK